MGEIIAGAYLIFKIRVLRDELYECFNHPFQIRRAYKPYFAHHAAANINGYRQLNRHVV